MLLCVLYHGCGIRCYVLRLYTRAVLPLQQHGQGSCRQLTYVKQAVSPPRPCCGGDNYFPERLSPIEQSHAVQRNANNEQQRRTT
jgi:hypothetical protein